MSKKDVLHLARAKSGLQNFCRSHIEQASFDFAGESWELTVQRVSH